MKSLLLVRRLLRGVRHGYRFAGWQVWSLQFQTWCYCPPAVARAIIIGHGFRGKEAREAWRRLRTRFAHRVPVRLHLTTKWDEWGWQLHHCLQAVKNRGFLRVWLARAKLPAGLSAAGLRMYYEKDTGHYGIPDSVFRQIEEVG